jgi:hypothetical protein
MFRNPVIDLVRAVSQQLADPQAFVIGERGAESAKAAESKRHTAQFTCNVTSARHDGTAS